MFVFACQPPLEFSKSIGNDLGRNRQTFIFFNLVFICSMFTSKQGPNNTHCAFFSRKKLVRDLKLSGTVSSSKIKRNSYI